MSAPPGRRPAGPWANGAQSPKPRPGLDQLTAAVIGPGPRMPATPREEAVWAAHLAGRLVLGNGGAQPLTAT